MSSAILKVLTASSEKLAKSVAIPFIGTGRLGCSAKDVSRVLLDAAATYLSENPTSTVQKIVFINHPKDQKIFDVFMTEFKLRLTQAEESTFKNMTFTISCLDRQSCVKALDAYDALRTSMVAQKNWDKSPDKTWISDISDSQVQLLRKRALDHNICMTLEPLKDKICIEGLKSDVEAMEKVINLELQLVFANDGKPVGWSDTGENRKQVYKLTPLNETSEEFKRVKALFLKTARNGSTVISIKQIENVALITQYKAQTKRVECETDADVVTRKELWHGTTAVNAEKIYRSEFNRSFAGTSFGIRFGQGSYFSTTVSYSTQFTSKDPNGHRHMILASVLVGNYYKGDDSIRRQNLKQGYHSTVDDVNNPTIFVVYHDAAAYPKYEIKFTYN